MSLAPPAQGGRISLLLAFVFPAMVAAAIALAYYGYQGAQDVESTMARQFIDAAGARAADLMDRVDLDMNAQVHAVFDQLSASLDETSLPMPDKCAAGNSSLVEAFAISSEEPKPSFECIGPARLTAAQKKRIEEEVERHSKDFKFASVAAGQLKYVHRSYPQPGFLYVVKRYRAADERSYFLLAKLRVAMARNMVDEALRKLGGQYRVAGADERGNTLPDAVYGGSEPDPSRERVYSAPLSTKTVYSWGVRIAQPDQSLRAVKEQARRRRLIQVLQVGASTVIIAVGMGVVLLAVMAERRASRLKSDFIANVSHELKTPLSLIRMFGEMVATGRHKGEDKAREYGGIITRESERLAHLIDNVLDFARLERGKASYDFSEGDVASVVDRALDVCRYRLEKERVKLRTRIDRHLPPVRMDENALTLVILNLVDNAVKYAAEGGVVEVTLGRAPGGVVLGVRDYGPGIPRDEQARIFERFYRAQSARDRNVRGSGIGLALVRHIAEAHGGRVTLDSPIPAAQGAGPGAIFRVFLPAPVVEVAGASAPESEAAADADGDRMVLAADPGPKTDPAATVPPAAKS